MCNHFDLVRNDTEKLDPQKERRQVLCTGPSAVPDDMCDILLDDHVKPDGDHS